MAEKLFDLKDVPEGEAMEVRHLLDEHGIEYYETHAGGFAIGTAAIWLVDHDRFKEARELIDGYQQEHTIAMRAEYDQMRRAGTVPTIASRFRSHPLMMTIFIFVLLLILYASLSPFLNFGE